MGVTAYGGKAFTQFAETTGPTLYSGTEDVINDAQKVNYNTLGYCLRGQEMADILKGGSSIQDRVYLTTNARDTSYLPGQPMSYQVFESGKTWSADWRYFMNYMSWNDETVMKNTGGSQSTATHRFHQYKSLWREYQQDLATDQANSWEQRLWAQPSYDDMEGTEAKEMFSIPTFITENDQVTIDGNLFGQHPLQADGTAYNGGGAIAGIDPDTSPRWSNVVEEYGGASANGFTIADADNILTALDRAYLRTEFQPPPMGSEYFEAPQKLQRPMPFLACGLTGQQKLMYVYRESQDRWVDMKDPFGKPTYAGAPIVYVAQLDTAALYDDGSSGLAIETGANVTGPRYYGIQPQYMRPVYHEDRYFESLGVFTDKDQPTTHIMPVNTWGQLAPRSRVRHFILTPQTSH